MYPALLTQERVFMSLTQTNFFESLSLNQKYTPALYRHLFTAFPTLRILVKITTVVMQIYLKTLSFFVTLKNLCKLQGVRTRIHLSLVKWVTGLVSQHPKFPHLQLFLEGRFCLPLGLGIPSMAPMARTIVSSVQSG